MPISEYSDTRLGTALVHYANLCAATHDVYVSDETVFESPAERALYLLLTQTRFFQTHCGQCRLVAQFEIGKYIRQEYRKFIPSYRVDFLLTLCGNGKEKSLVIEYDGVEYHTRNPEIVTAQNFDQEYLEYDVQRQLELESFGYSFLRINKFTLLPRRQGETPADVLNELLERAFA
jgi:very-short-patch-repair endonuclease